MFVIDYTGERNIAKSGALVSRISLNLAKKMI
jgi:hypothetical protein